MRVLVLGVTGGVGRHLLATSLAAGHEVSVLVRASSVFEAPSGVRVVRGALLDDREALDQAMAGVEAVLCSVGMQRRTPPTRTRSRSLRAISPRRPGERSSRR
jgi:uncharacterized protein YbjT (DUF2867 family)